jgi:hypothetical protein
MENNFMDVFEKIGKEIGSVVSAKNTAYGDSFSQSGLILKILYPNGISVDQYDSALYIVRTIDKLFRIATMKDAFGENPAMDICGYSILDVWRDMIKKGIDANTYFKS